MFGFRQKNDSKKVIILLKIWLSSMNNSYKKQIDSFKVLKKL